MISDIINDLLALRTEVSIDQEAKIDAIIRKITLTDVVGACSTCDWLSDMTYEGTETCEACLKANNYKNLRMT